MNFFHVIFFFNRRKVHIPTYSDKATLFLRNLHRRFVPCSNGQIYGGDFAKFCGHLRIYELYRMHCIYVVFCAAYSVLFYQKYSNVLKRCYSLLLTWKILNPSYIVTWLSKHVVVPMINVSICKLFVLKRRFAVLGTLAICFVFSSLFSNFVVSYFLHANKSLWIIHIFASNNNHPDHHRFANLKINERKKLTFYFGVLLFLTYILLHYILILNLWFISFFVSMICMYCLHIMLAAKEISWNCQIWKLQHC